MPHIAPFRGIKYNREKVKQEEVMTVPYDQIKDKMQQYYYNISPYNFVRLIFGKTKPTDDDENNRYIRAVSYYHKWREEGIFSVDSEPSLYLYVQDFVTPTGEKKSRKGFIALMGLASFESGIVLPHEKTLAKPKKDRLALMQASNCNFEHVFMLYPDKTNEVNALLEPFFLIEPDFVVIDEKGDKHSLWTISNKEVICHVTELMEDRPVFIADGHHRYETSLDFQKIKAKENPQAQITAPFNYRMATFVNVNDSGLVILPTHRLVKNLYNFVFRDFLTSLSKYFYIEEKEVKNVAYVLKEMGERAMLNKHAFGLYARGTFYLLTLTDENIIDTLVEPTRHKYWKELDVTILHSIIIEHVLGITKEKVEQEANISYIRYATEGVEEVDKNNYQLMLLLNPTKIDQVKQNAQVSEKMPQKSTDFYPKLYSGLVFFDMEENKVIEDCRCLTKTEA